MSFISSAPIWFKYSYPKLWSFSFIHASINSHIKALYIYEALPQLEVPFNNPDNKWQWLDLGGGTGGEDQCLSSGYTAFGR